MIPTEELGDEEQHVPEEALDDEARIEKIEKQFSDANDATSLNVPKDKKVKSMKKFVPVRSLIEIDVHLVRFKPDERILRDDTKGSGLRSTILVHRNQANDEETRRNPYDPLSLFSSSDHSEGKKRKKSESDEDDEDELFGGDDDEEEQTKHTSRETGGDSDTMNRMNYLRDYSVQLNKEKAKFDSVGMIFSEEAVSYFELEQDTLRLLRHKQYHDNERLRNEKDIEVVLRPTMDDNEELLRKRRRIEIEGRDHRLF